MCNYRNYSRIVFLRRGLIENITNLLGIVLGIVRFCNDIYDILKYNGKLCYCVINVTYNVYNIIY